MLMLTAENKYKNLHLGLSAAIVVIAGLAYGIAPKYLLKQLFDIDINSLNQLHIFRAMMGLYIAIAAFWIVGIIKPPYWRDATLSAVIFLGGLALGRIVSMLADGIPGRYFVIGFFMELLLCAWGIINLKKYNRTNMQH